MRFADLAELADRLAAEGSKLRKRAAIAEVLRRAAKESAAEAGRFCLYLAGQPFAEADPRKLNAGGAILSRALKEISGATDSALNLAYRKHGDLGAAAFEVLQASSPEPPVRDQPALMLSDVADAFDAMARARTTAIRLATVKGLLRRAAPIEVKYLLKLMLGDMRIGVKQSLVEEAIAVAAGVDVAEVRHAVTLEADLSRAVERAFGGTLSEARMRLFHPLGFMLASPVDTPEEAVERFTAKAAKPAASKPKKRRGKNPADILPEDAAEEGLAVDLEAEAASTPQEPQGITIHALIEDKYDGIRAQVHCGDPEQPSRVAIYSRNREDITESFPELAEAFAKVAGDSGLVGAGGGMILDGEILGWDLAAERALPFAVLGQRIGRKRVDDAMRRAIPVIFMAFDLMAAGGELVLPHPLCERRARLESLVDQLGDVAVSPIKAPKAQSELFDAERSDSQPGDVLIRRLRLSPAKLAESAEGIDRAYADARARSNEGVMIKAAGSAYLPGRRGLAWLKLKRELATLDVVITGAEFGHGRRAGLLSDYTFAVRGPRGANGEPDELLNVGKAYSGVTDVEIAELTEWLKAHTIEDFGYFRTVEPIRVLEVAFNNVMRSDRHSSGFALRFPRILRVRDDKPVEEIDTLERVEEIYQSQPDKI